MKAAWLACLAVLLVAPATALAHGGTHHDAAPPSSEMPASVPLAIGNAAAVASPSCPGDHGGLCTCGSDLACPANPVVLIAGQAALATVLLPSPGVPLERAMPRAPPRPFSLHFSRAPPSFS